MIFLDFSQLLKVFSVQNKKKYFSENQAKFLFDLKIFLVDQPL
jgi:hypothetical protein